MSPSLSSIIPVFLGEDASLSIITYKREKLKKKKKNREPKTKEKPGTKEREHFKKERVASLGSE